MDDDEDNFPGLDLSGNLPKIEGEPTGIGHNSEAIIIGRVKNVIDSLIKLAEEHEHSLQTLVDKQEGEREEILLVLGRELLVGRKPFEDESGNLQNKRDFGLWISFNFPNLKDIIQGNEQTAIIWAAEFPEQHQLMLEKHPRVRTTRGLHAKWKEEKKKEEGKPPNKPSSGSGGKGAGLGNSAPPPPPQQDDEPPSDNSNGINTKNPDTTSVKIEATMIASSLVGVVTNMLMFESTQGREVGQKELASAIFDEVRTQSLGQLTEDEVEDFIENKLKRTLNIIMSSLPVLNGFETNVVKITKKVENR